VQAGLQLLSLLELLNLAHHLGGLCSLSFSLTLKILVLLLQALHLLAKIGTVGTTGNALSLSTRLCFATIVLGLFSVLNDSSISVDASQMLVEVLLPRKSFSSVAFAIYMWAVQLLSRTTMLVMNFTLVSEKTARVREAWELFATFSRTLVGSVMLVHVFAMTQSALEDQ